MIPEFFVESGAAGFVFLHQIFIPRNLWDKLGISIWLIINTAPEKEGAVSNKKKEKKLELIQKKDNDLVFSNSKYRLTFRTKKENLLFLWFCALRKTIRTTINTLDISNYNLVLHILL